MSRQIEREIELRMIIDFNFSQGGESKFSGEFGNYLPGKDPVIDQISVSLSHPIAGTIDITRFLSDKDFECIEKECWDSVERDED